MFFLILIQGCSSGGDSSNVDTNSSPIADAGNDQTVFVGIAVSLIGSNSTDADSDQLTYFWSFELIAGIFVGWVQRNVLSPEAKIVQF